MSAANIPLRNATGGDTRIWHGGKPGLVPGDLVLPGHQRRTHEGCEWCAARARGEAHLGMDPPSAKVAVYVTREKEYARFYASLWGRGDLYTVEPLGELVPSDEDHIPSWTCEAARVVKVYQRAVLLTMTQRRALFRQWKAADEAVMRTRGMLPPLP